MVRTVQQVDLSVSCSVGVGGEAHVARVVGVKVAVPLAA